MHISCRCLPSAVTPAVIYQTLRYEIEFPREIAAWSNTSQRASTNNSPRETREATIKSESLNVDKAPHSNDISV